VGKNVSGQRETLKHKRVRTGEREKERKREKDERTASFSDAADFCHRNAFLYTLGRIRSRGAREKEREREEL